MQEVSVRFKRLVLALLLCSTALVAACGGGGGSSSPAAPAPVVTPRAGLLFGYFGDGDHSVADTADHINVNFVSCFGRDTPELLPVCAGERLTQARAMGITKSILGLEKLAYVGSNENPQLRENLRTLFNELRNANVLADVIALYPRDEPELYGISDATANSVNTHVREIAAEFGITPAIAVIYGGQDRDTPGISTVDWIGFDDYGRGSGVLARYTGKASQQKWILVPGGANPWRNDPQPFLDRAYSDPDVVAIIAFIWLEGAAGTGAGIGSNGMAPAYRAIGQRIKGNP